MTQVDRSVPRAESLRAESLRAALLLGFCVTVTALAVFEQYQELPAALVAFAAAWYVVHVRERSD